MAEDKKHLLVVDDDTRLRSLLQRYLREQGFLVSAAENAERAKDFLSLYTFDLLIVDIMMPRMDGIHFVKELRKFSTVPVIFLSAKSEDSDKILGLNIGADDYVSKPFNPLELVARVKSNLRRYVSLGRMVEKENVYSSGGLVIDDNSKECFVYGESIRLTPIEYNILAFLVKNKGKVYSINQIYEQIWHDSAVRVDNTIAVHIRHIREKIEINPKDPKFLKVVWGVGYKVEDDVV